MMLRIQTSRTRVIPIVKSDRINALRKQYDSFLEEDKRRKERNEFILGKLDNIRYNSTAVQIRKPIVYGDTYPAYNRLLYRPDNRIAQIVLPPEHVPHLNHHTCQVDVPTKYIDDTSLLKEISKKYILIPRLRPSLVDDYVETVPPPSLSSMTQHYSPTPSQKDIINNDDWKSKYDILDKLKNNEKEEQANKFYAGNDSVPVKDEQPMRINDTKNNNVDFDLQPYNKADDITTKYKQEIPEKDSSFDNIEQSSDKIKTSALKVQDPIINHAEALNESVQRNSESNAMHDHLLQSQGLDYTIPKVENDANLMKTQEHYLTATESNVEDVPQVTEDKYEPNQGEQNMMEQAEYEQHEYPQQEQYLQDQYHQEQYSQEQYPQEQYQQEQYPQQEGYPANYDDQIPLESDAVYPDPEKVYLDKDDYSPIEIVTPAQLVEEMNKEQIANEITKDNDDTEYPAELLNTQDFTPVEGVQLEEGVNVNPVFAASEDNVVTYENPEIETVEMDKEHTVQPLDNTGIEDFDAEQREMFYSEETNAYAYDPQVAAGDGYNQEYAPNEYQENQGMNYYGGAEELQQQAYPVEINEHEETSTRYDQNYEQQYMNQYEEQAYQPEQEIKYDAPLEAYEPHQEQYQEYQYEQPDNVTLQNVEQVLDTEQGLSERQDAEGKSEKSAIEQAGKAT